MIDKQKVLDAIDAEDAVMYRSKFREVVEAIPEETTTLGQTRANDYRAMRDKAKTARAEAIKEFWNRLTNAADTTQVNAFQYAYVVREEDADAIIKEMVGDEQ